MRWHWDFFSLGEELGETRRALTRQFLERRCVLLQQYLRAIRLLAFQNALVENLPCSVHLRSDFLQLVSLLDAVVWL